MFLCRCWQLSNNSSNLKLLNYWAEITGVPLGVLNPITIGDQALRNSVVLAPMSGITDVPFRRLAWKFGAGLVASEMVASQAYLGGLEEMRLKAEGAGLPIHMVQLSGREPQWMAEAVQVAEGAGATIIDINMGCPAKRVTSGYSGSALMRDLDRAMAIIDATVEAASVPVTLKMRLGWDDATINAPELAQRAEAAGITMITVHGRTRCQFYKGNANWSAVRAVRDVTNGPLLVNGDIEDIDSARGALKLSGADGVMIGRAAYGRPWLPGVIAQNLGGDQQFKEPSGEVLWQIVRDHYEAILDFYGPKSGVKNARKHLSWYFDQLPNPQMQLAPFRKLALTSHDPNAVLNVIDDVFGPNQAMAAA